MEMNQSRLYWATPGEWHSHHSLWCLMELHSVQPRQPWVVALIASHQTGPWGAWVRAAGRRSCLLQGQWWKTLASMGQSSHCVIMGWGLHHLPSLKEAGEGNIRGALSLGLVDLKPQRGLGQQSPLTSLQLLGKCVGSQWTGTESLLFQGLIKNNLEAP